MTDISSAIEAIVLATSTNETKARGRVRKVTFEIDAEGPNPFEGLGGERLHLVVLRLNNDETTEGICGTKSAETLGGQCVQPVEQEPVSPERHSWATLSPTTQCAMRCQEPQFREFLAETLKRPVRDCPEAIDTVRRLLGLKSRRELNTDKAKAAAWCLLEHEYGVWLWQNGYRSAPPYDGCKGVAA